MQKLFGLSSLIPIFHTLSISIFYQLHLCILIQNLPTVCSDSSLAKSRSLDFCSSLLSLLQTAFLASSLVPLGVCHSQSGPHSGLQGLTQSLVSSLARCFLAGHPRPVQVTAAAASASVSCPASALRFPPWRVLPSDTWGLPAFCLPRG